MTARGFNERRRHAGMRLSQHHELHLRKIHPCQSGTAKMGIENFVATDRNMSDTFVPGLAF